MDSSRNSPADPKKLRPKISGRERREACALAAFFGGLGSVVTILFYGQAGWLVDVTLFVFLITVFAAIGYVLGPKRLEILLPLLGPLFGSDPAAFVSNRVEKNAPLNERPTGRDGNPRPPHHSPPGE